MKPVANDGAQNSVMKNGKICPKKPKNRPKIDDFGEFLVMFVTSYLRRAVFVMVKFGFFKYFRVSSFQRVVDHFRAIKTRILTKFRAKTYFSVAYKKQETRFDNTFFISNLEISFLWILSHLGVF